ncbi:MAG TPA: Smr/MutS family protein [Pseudolabrys sp.]|nr:Smr/MutS family protein [Pseudolabrys sp.]
MSGGGRRRGVTDDERHLWKTVTKAVAPLRPPRREQADMPAVPPVPRPKRVAAPAQPAKIPIALPTVPATAMPAALGRKLKQRVARGREPIDARLDLHGMTQSEAHAALLRFLRSAAGKGAKLVLVITGKSGVLRQQTPHWLALTEFREHVIGFEAAHLTHGGEGALYVRVRRRRTE